MFLGRPAPRQRLLTRAGHHGDGSTVAFVSSATNLVTGQVDPNGGGTDVFAFQRAGGQVSLGQPSGRAAEQDPAVTFRSDQRSVPTASG